MRRPRTPVTGRLTWEVELEGWDLLQVVALPAFATAGVNASTQEALLDSALTGLETALSQVMAEQAAAVREAVSSGQPRGVQVQSLRLAHRQSRLVSSLCFSFQDLKSVPLIRGVGTERPFRNLGIKRQDEQWEIGGPVLESLPTPEAEGPEEPRCRIALEVDRPVLDHDADQAAESEGGFVRLEWSFALPRKEAPYLWARLGPPS